MKHTALILFLCLPISVQASQTNIAGWLERVQILDINSSSNIAKLDTGADNSSLHAKEIILFEKDHEQWVRFSTIGDQSLQAKLQRTVQIKMKNGKRQYRPVIELTICIGDKLKQIEVNLVDRAHFRYPMLLGRSALEGLIIDPSNTYVLKEPACE